jgi:hypothetical protein
MAKRSKKSPRTDIIDAVVQDVELTIEQAGQAGKEAAKAAGRALTKVVKSKDLAPDAAPLVQDRRFKLPR